jgi:hypothetical protein
MKLHVRLNGESKTFDAERVGAGRQADDRAIREILSGIYELPPGAFKDMVIDRNPDGIVVRPSAVFG